jgi:hypothetical protein
MADAPSQNTLEILDDGILFLTQVGHQTAASLGQYQAEMDKITAERLAKGIKTKILVDLSQVTGHDPSALEEGRRRLNGDYEKLAICGNSTAIRLIVNWLIRAVGNKDKVQFFSTKEEGLAWLRK